MLKKSYVREHTANCTLRRCSRLVKAPGHESRGIVSCEKDTVERSLDLKGLQMDRHYDGILLEDLGNLLANEIFSPDGTAQNCVNSILDGVEKLKSYCDTLVIVSNEIFSDGGSYPPETENYLQKLAELQKKIARDADAVYESVCGILLPIKEGRTR